MSPLTATFIGDHRYDDQLPNSIGPDYLAESRRMNQRYLAEIRAIDPATLGPADRISYEMFVYEREREVRGERFPQELLPINQAGSLLTLMPALGSGTNAQPFKTVQDYDNWLKRSTACRVDGPGDREHARGRRAGRRAAATADAEGPAAARVDDRGARRRTASTTRRSSDSRRVFGGGSRAPDRGVHRRTSRTSSFRPTAPA